MKKFCFLSLCLLSFGLTAQHSMVLKSGEKLEGVVLSLKNDVWTIYVDGAEKKVHMKEIKSVFLDEYVPYDGLLLPDGNEEVIQVNGFTVKYQVKDRRIVEKPEVSIGTEDHGTVVVKIVIDRYGHVLSAEPGQPGSTTSNDYLYTKAKIAAKSAKFDKHLKGPLKTEGLFTIIY